MNGIELSLMNTPDVIMRDTSNGTRYAMAKSTDLKAIEKKYPEKMIQCKITMIHLISRKVYFFHIPHAVAMFITKTAITDVNTKA